MLNRSHTLMLFAAVGLAMQNKPFSPFHTIILRTHEDSYILPLGASFIQDKYPPSQEEEIPELSPSQRPLQEGLNS